MIQIAPSILSADFNHLGRQISQVEALDVKILHIDVMDGMFVPSISFGMPVIASIRKNTKLFFDVHMMVQDPQRYVEALAKSGADMMTIHAEACHCIADTIQKIHDHNMILICILCYHIQIKIHCKRLLDRLCQHWHELTKENIMRSLYDRTMKGNLRLNTILTGWITKQKILAALS